MFYINSPPYIKSFAKYIYPYFFDSLHLNGMAVTL